MTGIIYIFASLAQCLFLLLLARTGQKLRAKNQQDSAALTGDADTEVGLQPWPQAALIVPVAGSHPSMANSLQSLLRQDYPHFTPIFVTATAEEKATELIQSLQEQFPALRHVIAGPANNCGQKNHNSLCGVKAADTSTQVLVFCDSTHPARPDFLRSLVGPIAREEADFTTGYHQVYPKDSRTTTLAYALCVLLMRLLQALAPFTQPWGGAMAIRRCAFIRHDIAKIWANNVVDDCSLAGALPGLGVKVRLCPNALLDTEAAAHPLQVWKTWMERQVLFLKFCVPSQWVLLGILCLIMALPLCWGALILCVAAFSMKPEFALYPLLHGLLLTAVMNIWRKFLPVPVPLAPWMKAFVCATGMFVYVYTRNIFAKGLVWYGINYTVGRGGKVIAMSRRN